MMTFGRDLIKAKLDNMPELPGIYRMYNSASEVLYIGKAKNLKKRLTNYISTDLITRTIKLISLVHNIEYTVTNSETDALLLEAQLIKKFQPKFNILLKDDKSFPYIKLRLDHEFPVLSKYRGKDLTGGKFFGPFASIMQVNTTVTELQKIFRIRSCTDDYFATRKRPCLQYQIGRCYAPCVGKISAIDYKALVSELTAFLSGKTVELQKILAQKMENLSEDLRFEEAAQVRDRIKALSYTQAKSSSIIPKQNTDVIAIAFDSGNACIQVFTYRSGQFYGNKNYCFTGPDEDYDNILPSFIIQYYQTRPCPEEIIINHHVDEAIIDALKKLHNMNVKISVPKQGDKLSLINHAYSNATLSLAEFTKNSTKNAAVLKEIRELFNLDPDKPISRIEVYDNSHIMGAFAVSAMVVATIDGFDKKEYRTFSVPNSNGDDYEMLRQGLTRRLLRLKENPEKTPDLIIIDGGKGHMSVVSDVMSKLNVSIPFVCMSKGPDRNAGLEDFHMPKKQVFTLDKNTQIMKYLQILRDEAHNFAIKNHRLKRAKSIKTSSLDAIPGIGEKRKKALLNYFGSFEDIKSASANDLLKVQGINKSVAEKIIETLRQLS